MALEIPGQTDPQAEQKAAFIAAAKKNGGFCHRATTGAILMAQGLGGVQPVPAVASVPCFGRDGLCQMWDADNGQCIDRTLANVQINAALGRETP